jgi:hypothetical protein
MRRFNGSHPPQRDWARTDARTERLNARGESLRPRRRPGPQTRGPQRAQNQDKR